MDAIRLRTEYMKDPKGLDILHPHLFWNCIGGVSQTAYQIIAYINEEEVWNTGKVMSNQMAHIVYAGKPLQSRDLVCWSVTLWDEHDLPGKQQSATFEMGLLAQEDWTSHWISAPLDLKDYQRYPVDYFQKKFTLSKKVKRARMYATALGVYDITINNRLIEDFYLAPGSTDYRKRVQYQVYDVTTYLQEENELVIKLGDGWYRGSVGCFGLVEVFGEQTALRCQLEIQFEDDTNIVIPSDASFKWSNDGPIRFSDLKDGEIIDANLKPSFSSYAKEVEKQYRLTASNNVYVKKQEQFLPTLSMSPSGKQLLDFKQNIAGILSFHINAKKGQRLKLRFGELIDTDGELTQKNFAKKKPVGRIHQKDQLHILMKKWDEIDQELQQTPLQELQYTCHGELDTYTSSFCIFGFRYVEVDCEFEIDPKDFTAIAVYSDMEEVGRFTCSNAKVTKFFQNTMWSMKGNFADVPTDCPTRERLAWTGDGQLFFHTAAYLMDVASFYRKWLYDFQDGQFENGKSSAVIPYSGFEMLYNNTGGSVGWADAVVLLPYRFWLVYQDKRILEDCYYMMRNYAMYVIGQCGLQDPVTAQQNPYDRYTYEKGFHLGEWLEPEDIRPKDISNKPPTTEEATAYLCYTMTCMKEIAEVLGKDQDYLLYQEYAEGAKKAYQYLFLKDGEIDAPQQAKYVRPLAFGLLPEEHIQTNVNKLREIVKKREYKIGTGFLSTPFILPVLTNAGYVEDAYRMLENEQCPGWLAEVNKGATTVWEDWEGKDSHNHYSPGAICEWLFSTVCGIKVSGVQHFDITPYPGGSFTYANAEYGSMYGTVKSGWEKTDQTIKFTITIPSNTTATLRLGTHLYQIEAGTHCFYQQNDSLREERISYEF